MIKRIVLVSVIAAALSGCVNLYPLPIQEPAALDSKKQRVEPDYQRGGLLPAKTIEHAIENLKIYGDSYQDYGNKLRRNEYISSDIAFIGGILGVAGGLTKSVETVIAGAVLGSGGLIVSERYQFLVQATNYEKASDAMYCMYSQLYPVSGGSIPFGFVNERIDEVRRKLRNVQSKVQLASPDLSKLETSLSEIINGKEAELFAKNKVAAKLKILKSEMKKCVAAF